MAVWRKSLALLVLLISLGSVQAQPVADCPSEVTPPIPYVNYEGDFSADITVCPTVDNKAFIFTPNDGGNYAIRDVLPSGFSPCVLQPDSALLISVNSSAIQVSGTFFINFSSSGSDDVIITTNYHVPGIYSVIPEIARFYPNEQMTLFSVYGIPTANLISGHLCFVDPSNGNFQQAVSVFTFQPIFDRNTICYGDIGPKQPQIISGNLRVDTSSMNIAVQYEIYFVVGGINCADASVELCANKTIQCSSGSVTVELYNQKPISSSRTVVTLFSDILTSAIVLPTPSGETITTEASAGVIIGATVVGVIVAVVCVLTVIILAFYLRNHHYRGKTDEPVSFEMQSSKSSDLPHEDYDSLPIPPAPAHDKPMYEPPERWGHAVCEFDKKLYLVGGRGISTSSVDIFDPATFTWKQQLTKGPNPTAIDGCAYTVVDKQAFFFGGCDDRGHHNDLWVLDLMSLSWKRILQPKKIPFVRRNAGLVGYLDMLILYGGEESGHNFNDIWLFNLSDYMWISPNVTGTQPPKLNGFTFTQVGKQAVLFGGRVWKKHRRMRKKHTDLVYMNNVYTLDLNKWHWTKETTDSTVQPCERYFHAACSIGTTHLLVTGGWNGGAVSDSWILNLQSRKWKKVEQQSGGVERRGHTATAVITAEGAQILYFGGYIDDHTVIATTVVLSAVRGVEDEEWEVVKVENLEQQQLGPVMEN